MSFVKWKASDINKLAKKGIAVKCIIVKAKKSKYNNTVVVRNGRKFDSKKEADRFPDLFLLQKAGKIANLKCQQEFKFVINGLHVCSYIADFTYDNLEKQNEFTVEDVKSVATRKIKEYRIKKRLMEACFSIKILET